MAFITGLTLSGCGLPCGLRGVAVQAKTSSWPPVNGVRSPSGMSNNNLLTDIGYTPSITGKVNENLLVDVEEHAPILQSFKMRDPDSPTGIIV